MDKVYNCVVTKYNCQIILTYLNAFKKLKPTLSFGVILSEGDPIYSLAQ